MGRAMATTGIPQQEESFGKRPVLLNNPKGWANVTRFTTLMMAKLSSLERKNLSCSVTTLQRAITKIERRHLREGFVSLHHNSSFGTFVTARSHAEDMLQKLHSLVD